MEPQEIVKRSGFVIEKQQIKGGAGLLLSGCSDVKLVDLDISGSNFSGLNLHACRNVRVIGGLFHGNGRVKGGSNSGRIGHGIHLAGECADISIEGAEAKGNFEDGVQTANSFSGTVTLADCRFHDNMENAVDQKGGVIIHIRPDYFGNGDGRGMEPIVIHNNATLTRISGGRLVAKDDKGACLKVTNGAVVQIQATVLDARNAQAFCLEGFEQSTIEVFEATLYGSRDRPIVKTRGVLRMTSCRMRSTYPMWIVTSDKDLTKEAVLRGVDTPRLAAINCGEAASEPAR